MFLVAVTYDYLIAGSMRQFSAMRCSAKRDKLITARNSKGEGSAADIFAHLSM